MALGWGLAQRNRWAIRATWLVLFVLFIITVQNAEPHEDGWKIALPCFLIWLSVTLYYWRQRPR